MRVQSFAPAKINLSLAVGPTGPDGRHPLESLVAFADVGDRVSASLAQGLDVEVTGPFAADLAGEGDNLVLRAARLLQRQAGMATQGARLTLDKHLPIASGVGGGSSDAAAALRVLNRLWSVGASLTELERLAAGFGADGPVCVRARSAIMTGGGEIAEPLAMPDLNVVLINPLVPAPTSAVYRAFDQMGGGGTFAAGATPLGPWSSAGAFLSTLSRLSNDLTAPAACLVPAINDVFQRLAKEPTLALSRLSGSGATVIAYLEGAAAAAALAQDLNAEARGWWVRAARLGAVDVDVVEV